MSNQSLCSIVMNSTTLSSRDKKDWIPLRRHASVPLSSGERGQGSGNADLAFQNQRGASLIEVLVAVLVLSIGLLGIAALQTRSLKNTDSSLNRSQAVMLSYFILDAMRVNRTAALNGAYDLVKTCSVVADAGNLVSHDLHAWLQAIKNELGNYNTSCGEISCQSNGECTVKVYWDDSRGTEGSASQMIETRTRL